MAAESNDTAPKCTPGLITEPLTNPLSPPPLYLASSLEWLGEIKQSFVGARRNIGVVG